MSHRAEPQDDDHDCTSSLQEESELDASSRGTIIDQLDVTSGMTHHHDGEDSVEGKRSRLNTTSTYTTWTDEQEGDQRSNSSKISDHGSNLDLQNYGKQHDITQSDLAMSVSASAVTVTKGNESAMSEIHRAALVTGDEEAPPLTIANTFETTTSSAGSANDGDEVALEDNVTAKGFSQFHGLAWKNVIAKKRTPVSTLFELFSPVFLSLILVGAYHFSDVYNYLQASYTTLSFDLPGVWRTLAVSGFCAAYKNIQGSDPVLPSLLCTDENGGQVDNVGDNFNTSNLLGIANWKMEKIIRQPLVIPTLEQYVVMSSLVGQALHSQPNHLDLLQRSTVGRTWENLLTLGTLHLCPNTSVVTQELYGYLNETYPSLLVNDTLRVRMHSTQEEALLYINENLDERTWALIDTDGSHNSPPSEEEFFSKESLGNVSYTIRMNYTTLPNTNAIVDWTSVGLDTMYQRYYLSGYLTIMRVMEEFTFAHAKEVLNTSDSTSSTIGSLAAADDPCTTPGQLDMWSMPMPTRYFKKNTFFDVAGYLMGLTIAMGFLYPVSRLVKCIVEEKETRMKETLQILGVKSWSYWASWMVVSYALFTIDAILVTMALSGSVMKHSNLGYIFAFMFLFSTSVVSYSLFVSTFCARAKLAAIVGPLSLFVTLLPHFLFFGTNRYERVTGKIVASLLPCTAFALGTDIIAAYEAAEIGIQSYNANEGGYNFNISMLMLTADTFLYLALTWYFDAVIPSQYGVARKWWFPLTPRYWKGLLCCFSKCEDDGEHPVHADNLEEKGCCSSIWSKRFSTQRSVDADEEKTQACNCSALNFEQATSKCVSRVEIKDLVKQYKRNAPKAVDHLNLNLFENQITCLLGHNGAGKTTTISVLTGLFPPSSGEISIYGYSIATEVEKARMSMGICPQQNVLFPELTVEEHLYLFERMKGLKPTRKSVQKRAEDVGLGDKLKALSGALSGGMKRKLCVAIALCGDPKFVLLDEPTSGMDPYSRRATWDLLRRSKTGRVTLLTTHFMDEAEFLADRIAVMKAGKLQCCGSALFLKRRFGVGYSLSIVLNDVPDSSSDSNEKPRNNSIERDSESQLLTISSPPRRRNTLPSSDRATPIKSFLAGYIPSVELVRQSGRELTFRFPNESTGVFPRLFYAFEKVRRELGIGGYGLSNTSLEEVFLRLAEHENHCHCNCHAGNTIDIQEITESCDVKDEKKQISTVVPKIEEGAVAVAVESDRPANILNKTPSSTDVLKGHEDTTIRYLGWFGQIWVMLGKRATVQKRDHKGTFFMVVLPAIIVAVVLFVLTIDVSKAGPPITMSPDLYLDSKSGGSGKVTFGGSEAAIKATQKVKSTFAAEYLHAEVEHVVSASTSQKLSDFLLETVSSGARFGSYVVDDRIRLNLNIDWEEMEEPFENGFTFSDILDMLNLSAKILDGELLKPNFTLSPDALSLFHDNLTVYHEDLTIAPEGLGVSPENVSAIHDELSRVPEDLAPLQEESVNNENQTLPLVEHGSGRRATENVTWRPSFNPDNGDKLSDVKGVMDQVSSQTSDVDVSLSATTTSNFTNGFGGVSPDLLEQALAPFEAIGIDTANVTAEASQLEGLSSLNDLNLTEELTEAGRNETVPFPDVLPEGEKTYRLDVRSSTSVLHNSSSPHAVAVFNHAYLENQYKECVADPKATFSVVNHPLPLTAKQGLEVKTILSLFASMFILIPLCFVPSTFIVFQVRERTCKSKHVQLVSGVDLSAFWISHYLWDMAMYSVLTLLIMASFAIYGANAAEVFVGDTESLLCTFALIFGYGISALPFAYLISRNFRNHSSAQIAVLGVFFLFGFVTVNAYFIMKGIERTKDAAEILRNICRIFPAYNLGDAFVNISVTFWRRELFGSAKSPFDWDVAGSHVVLLYGLSVPYFTWFLFLEYTQDGGSGGFIGRSLRRIRDRIDHWLLRWYGVEKTKDGTLQLDDGLDPDIDEDMDVAKERDYVNENKEHLKENAAVLVSDLWKVYPASGGILGCAFDAMRWLFCTLCKSNGDGAVERPVPKRAVRGLSTAVHRGETFGLLGMNGAGKSTSLAVLTGDVTPTSGTACVAGFDMSGKVPGGVENARKRIGFCPQVDPLLDLMTGREALHMFGRLRGIPRAQLSQTVSDLMDALTLTPHADKPSETYSGGNKRKLSLGIALIGNPDVLFVDEASSGMDPAARRKMWELIAQVAQNRSVVLTTHSMEEAEALCTRLTIMVKGKMRCLGSVQHLKTTYVDGYTLDLQLKSDATPVVVEAVKQHVVETALPSSSLIEQYSRFLRFSVPSTSLGLGGIFGVLENMKDDPSLMVEDYALSQCTLEQVFLRLARQGECPAEEES